MSNGGNESNITKEFFINFLKIFNIGENLVNATKIISNEDISATDRNIALDTVIILMLPVVMSFSFFAGCLKDNFALYWKWGTSTTIVCFFFSSVSDTFKRKRHSEIGQIDKRLKKLYKKDRQFKQQIDKKKF